jgi:hypothetical protein
MYLFCFNCNNKKNITNLSKYQQQTLQQQYEQLSPQQQYQQNVEQQSYQHQQPKKNLSEYFPENNSNGDHNGVNNNFELKSVVTQKYTTDTIDKFEPYGAAILQKITSMVPEELSWEKYKPGDVVDNWKDEFFDSQKCVGTKEQSEQVYNNFYKIGQNTISSSLKNACWDIRGNIPTPKIRVSIWNESSIEPDFN